MSCVGFFGDLGVFLYIGLLFRFAFLEFFFANSINHGCIFLERAELKVHYYSIQNLLTGSHSTSFPKATVLTGPET